MDLSIQQILDEALTSGLIEVECADPASATALRHRLNRWRKRSRDAESGNSVYDDLMIRLEGVTVTVRKLVYTVKGVAPKRKLCAWCGTAFEGEGDYCAEHAGKAEGDLGIQI